MQKSLLIILVMLAGYACNPGGSVSGEGKAEDPVPPPATSRPEPAEAGVWSVRTFSNSDGNSGYGFDILNGEKIYVHQPTIPAVQGVRGFSSEANAKACGELMVYKIRNGILPPSVSVAELDSLGVSR
ncbi:MAG TPA: DUF4907 domain-containing protein [Bacteroidia bacterium]|nr:DUF4907 domain-containing protein [Bacteroidia bacterium]